MNSHHRVPENSALAETLALALVGVDRPVGGARQTEAGDVDEMAAGQRAMVVDIGDAARHRSCAPWHAAMRFNRRLDIASRPSPRAKSVPVPQGSRPSSASRPLS